MYCTNARYVVAIIATVFVCQCSSTYYVQGQIVGAVEQMQSPFYPSTLEARLRGNQLLNKKIEEAVLIEQRNGEMSGLTPREEVARKIQREVEREIVREHEEQKLKEVIQEAAMESALSLEEAALEARRIVRGQTHGQLSTFLTGMTAFDKSLVGTPVSSVELFVEECGNSSDLLVVGTELNARNLQSELSKATLFVQGNMQSFSPKMQRFVELSGRPMQKVEVVLVGHVQKIDTVSDSFMSARQCIQRIHPEFEILERVMPQRLGIWRFKIDSGVHLIDHIHKFIGWIPLQKYQQSRFFDTYPQYGPRFFPSEVRQMEFPTASTLSEFELNQMVRTPEMEQMYRPFPSMYESGLPLFPAHRLSPFARKLWQLKNARQSFPYGGQYHKYFNQYANVQEPTIVV